MAAKIRQTWRCKQNKSRRVAAVVVKIIWFSHYLPLGKRGMRWCHCHQMSRTIWKAHTCIVHNWRGSTPGGAEEEDASIWQFAAIGRMDDVWKVERGWESHSVPNSSPKRQSSMQGCNWLPPLHHWPGLCLPFFSPPFLPSWQRVVAAYVFAWSKWWLYPSCFLLFMSSDSINRNFTFFIRKKYT